MSLSVKLAIIAFNCLVCGVFKGMTGALLALVLTLLVLRIADELLTD
jgi:hypothetical protein